jgi:pSer/pThr/pTyr-binding forkhead associated (FHA) protein
VTFAIEVEGERRARLGPGGKLVVGRGDTADVWLEKSTVSRAHCEIVWDRGARFPRFRDLGSANGTRHEGRLEREGVLRAGETLEVGPYVLALVREEAPTSEAETQEEIDALFDAGPEFQGALGPGIASLMLRALAQAERTGTFEVALDRGTASAVLAGGRVVSARAGKLAGLAALHMILSAERGAYRFRRTFEVDDLEPVDLTVEEVIAAVPS